MTQKKSISKNNRVPDFKSEKEEADWMQSPAGKRDSERTYAKAKREGKFGKRPNVTPTDPAVLQELVDRVRAKQTQAVSLRLTVSDIEAAKKIGAQTGLGYQTVLKEIISKGLANSLRQLRPNAIRSAPLNEAVERVTHGVPAVIPGIDDDRQNVAGLLIDFQSQRSREENPPDRRDRHRLRHYVFGGDAQENALRCGRRR
jgi:hypothetical protein